jgi:CheY-like chemotaxis protein
MKNINHILLVYNNLEELESIELNLNRNGFATQKSHNMKDAIQKIKKTLPDIVVISDTQLQSDIDFFEKEATKIYTQKKLIPSFLKLTDYINIETFEHIVLRELARNKKLRNNETLFLISHSKKN